MEKNRMDVANRKKILVLCTGNSCRSQMMEGYLRHFGNEWLDVYSAGIETHGLNPGAVAIMQEDGISITHHTSNHILEYKHIDFDFILTVCDHAHENCPWFPGNAIRLHHNFFDPSKVKGTTEEIHAAFEKARNEIRAYANQFCIENR